jgi:GT2 family glycosyltransferase
MSSTEQPPRIAFLVVNYFSHTGVDQLLTSLTSNSNHRVTVSIVDNSNDPQEFVDLERIVSNHRKMADIQSHPADENLGYAAGNNLAFENLSQDFDFIAVVNPDVKIVSGDLADAIHTSGSDSTRSIFVPTTEEGLRRLSGTSAIKIWNGKSRKLEEGEKAARNELVYPDGHFLVLPMSMWRQLNGLNETYFLYCEEIDFTLRAMQAHDLKIKTLPNVTIQHVGGMTTGSETMKSLVTLHHSNRSRLITYRAHASLRRYVPSLVATRLAYAVFLGIRAQFSPMRAVISGLRAGATAYVPRKKTD